MILILTEQLDTHADHIVQKLRARRADFIRFDPARFPIEAELSLAFASNGRPHYTLRTDGRTIDLDELTAIWYRRPRPPIPHDHITEELNRESIAQECQNFVDDLWNSLDCLYLPAPHAAIRRAQFKASQLKIAGAVGFELPPTLFTNSPDDFLEFYRQHDGNIISKLSGFSIFRYNGNAKDFWRYTEVVSKRDVSYAHAVRYCPMIFQAYVPKQVELRITVVGRQVFAAEIHSQATNHTRHDWRRYDHYGTLYRPHPLPDEVAHCCVRLVEQLGLCYGTIDMVVTPDGRYVFLEINPNGQYLWTEEAAGLPISEAICDLLIEGAPLTAAAQHHAALAIGAL
jgi:hypothetical protein